MITPKKTLQLIKHIAQHRTGACEACLIYYVYIILLLYNQGWMMLKFGFCIHQKDMSSKKMDNFLVASILCM